MKPLDRYNCLIAGRFPEAGHPEQLLAKDNIGVAGWPTTGGSVSLAHWQLPDAFCIKQLKKAGYEIVGKTGMSELANFVSYRMAPGYCELLGQGINPKYPEFTPGGSSSGSAIAVAAGQTQAALGTETNGSIIYPALCCGVFGFKPSVGQISRTGLIPLSQTFDTPGVLADNPQILERVYRAMKGVDCQDAATQNPTFTRAPAPLKKSLRFVFLTPGNDTEPIFDAKRQARLSAFFTQLELAGHRITYAAMPEIEHDYAEIVGMQVQSAFDALLKDYPIESIHSFKDLVRSYQARSAQQKYGFDRLADALKYDPRNTKRLDELIERTVTRARGEIDRLLSENDADFVLCDRWCNLWPLAQAPYAAMPLSADANHRPVGITIGARFGEDDRVLAALSRLTALI